MNKIMYMILAIFLVLGCAHAKSKKKGNEQPEWLTNPAKVYPTSMYIVAVGEGDTRNDAESMAAGNLSRIFETKVKTETNIKQQYEELIKNDNVSTSEQTNSVKDVNLQSSQTLLNVQFSESYVDNKGRVHALAYIDRMKTADIYEEKINENSKRIENFLVKANSETKPIDKYAILNATSIIAQWNQYLLQQLDIIYPDMKEFIKINYNTDQVMKDFDTAAKAVTFSIDIEGELSEQLVASIKNLLTQKGFTLSSDALLKVTGNIKFEDVQLERKNKFVRWIFALDMKDPSENIVVSLSKKGREGHNTYDEAKARSIREIEKNITKLIGNDLSNYFNLYTK